MNGEYTNPLISQAQTPGPAPTLHHDLAFQGSSSSNTSTSTPSTGNSASASSGFGSNDDPNSYLPITNSGDCRTSSGGKSDSGDYQRPAHGIWGLESFADAVKKGDDAQQYPRLSDPENMGLGTEIGSVEGTLFPQINTIHPSSGSFWNTMSGNGVNQDEVDFDTFLNSFSGDFVST